MNLDLVLNVFARWLLAGVFHIMSALAEGCLWVARQATAGIAWLDARAPK